MGGGLESRCVGRVYGADGAVRRHHPNRTLDPVSPTCVRSKWALIVRRPTEHSHIPPSFRFL